MKLVYSWLFSLYLFLLFVLDVPLELLNCLQHLFILSWTLKRGKNAHKVQFRKFAQLNYFDENCLSKQTFNVYKLIEINFLLGFKNF